MDTLCIKLSIYSPSLG